MKSHSSRKGNEIAASKPRLPKHKRLQHKISRRSTPFRCLNPTYLHRPSPLFQRWARIGVEREFFAHHDCIVGSIFGDDLRLQNAIGIDLNLACVAFSTLRDPSILGHDGYSFACSIAFVGYFSFGSDAQVEKGFLGRLSVGGIHWAAAVVLEELHEQSTRKMINVTQESLFLGRFEQDKMVLRKGAVESETSALPITKQFVCL